MSSLLEFSKLNGQPRTLETTPVVYSSKQQYRNLHAFVYTFNTVTNCKVVGMSMEKYKYVVLHIPPTLKFSENLKY